MYRGKKFNSKKEDVPEERYLGIKRKSDTMAAPEPAKEAVPTPEAVPSTILRGLLTGYSSSSSQGSTK